jgi:hypothetical protein
VVAHRTKAFRLRHVGSEGPGTQYDDERRAVQATKNSEDVKRRALRLAARAARSFNEGDKKRAHSMLYAADCGASLREIAEATGVPHTTVRDIIGRYRES